MKQAARLFTEERGQGSVEVVLTLLFFLILLAAIIDAAWYWWGHLNAAIAVHDGVAAVARRGGSLEGGMAMVERRLTTALDPTRAEILLEGTAIEVDTVQRVVRGRIDARWTGLFFPLHPRIRAASVQRLENFYPGQPPTWPWE